jgi:hypothetical protein
LSDIARRAKQDRNIAATQANAALTHCQAQNIDSVESLFGSIDESEFITTTLLKKYIDNVIINFSEKPKAKHFRQILL